MYVCVCWQGGGGENIEFIMIPVDLAVLLVATTALGLA